MVSFLVQVDEYSRCNFFLREEFIFYFFPKGKWIFFSSIYYKILKDIHTDDKRVWRCFKTY